jgi:hypothetical protein
LTEWWTKLVGLLESGKVERLDTGSFNVVGDHGTYVVVETYDGKINCNCPGLVKKGRCSHSVAVEILKARSRKRIRIEKHKIR